MKKQKVVRVSRLAPVLAAKLHVEIGQAWLAYSQQPKAPRKAVRYFDGKTPYAVHPVWCAMSILQEEWLPERIRFRGARVLLWHDGPEDTTAPLPSDMTPLERKYVEQMTFENLDDEMKNLWSRHIEVILYKLYDKVSNLLDNSWMKPERHAQLCAHVERITCTVEPRYGTLNIVRMARALAVPKSAFV